MTPELEDAIARFEEAWRTGRKPPMAAFFRDAAADLSDALRRALAAELVKVDLEYRWCSAKAKGKTSALRLEAYASRLPVLGPVAKLPLDLIAEEYRVRRRFGDAPPVEEYYARFSRPRPELLASLQAVDRELAEEGLSIAAPEKRPPRQIGHAFDPQAPLYFGDYVLRRQIGGGGLCRVYAGLQVSLHKEVAVKVLRRRF